jgi:hypothetical protein
MLFLQKEPQKRNAPGVEGFLQELVISTLLCGCSVTRYQPPGLAIRRVLRSPTAFGVNAAEEEAVHGDPLLGDARPARVDQCPPVSRDSASAP